MIEGRPASFYRSPPSALSSCCSAAFVLSCLFVRGPIRPIVVFTPVIAVPVVPTAFPGLLAKVSPEILFLTSHPPLWSLFGLSEFVLFPFGPLFGWGCLFGTNGVVALQPRRTSRLIRWSSSLSSLVISFSFCWKFETSSAYARSLLS